MNAKSAHERTATQTEQSSVPPRFWNGCFSETYYPGLCAEVSSGLKRPASGHAGFRFLLGQPAGRHKASQGEGPRRFCGERRAGRKPLSKQPGATRNHPSTPDRPSKLSFVLTLFSSPKWGLLKRKCRLTNKPMWVPIGKFWVIFRDFP